MQTHHFEGLLGLATPHMELVSAHWPNLISHNPQLKERMTGLVPRTSSSVCTFCLLVVAAQASLMQLRSEPTFMRA